MLPLLHRSFSQFFFLIDCSVPGQGSLLILRKTTTRSRTRELPHFLKETISATSSKTLTRVWFLMFKFSGDLDDEGPIYNSYVGQPGVPTCPNYPSFSPINRVTVQFHGSGETMNTQCGSSSASSTALSGPTTPF